MDTSVDARQLAALPSCEAAFGNPLWTMIMGRLQFSPGPADPQEIPSTAHTRPGCAIARAGEQLHSLSPFLDLPSGGSVGGRSSAFVPPSSFSGVTVPTASTRKPGAIGNSTRIGDAMRALSAVAELARKDEVVVFAFEFRCLIPGNKVVDRPNVGRCPNHPFQAVHASDGELVLQPGPVFRQVVGVACPSVAVPWASAG